MPFLDTPEVRLHYEVHGEGLPVTVCGHGVGSSIGETRLFTAGVEGTLVFLHFRGHGESGVPDDGWGYAAMSRDLRAVADHTEATQVLGISLGAGAALRVLAETPDRFARCVFLIPAVLDQLRETGSRDGLLELADLLDRGDVEAIADHHVNGLPEDFRELPGIRGLMRERALVQLKSGVRQALRGLATEPAIAERAALARVTAPSLVIGQEGDEQHPAQVARELAAALPNARLHVFDAKWALLRERELTRGLITDVLNRAG